MIGIFKSLRLRFNKVFSEFKVNCIFFPVEVMYINNFGSVTFVTSCVAVQEAPDVLKVKTSSTSLYTLFTG